jgi:hypothetical protein
MFGNGGALGNGLNQAWLALQQQHAAQQAQQAQQQQQQAAQLAQLQQLREQLLAAGGVGSLPPHMQAYVRKLLLLQQQLLAAQPPAPPPPPFQGNSMLPGGGHLQPGLQQRQQQQQQAAQNLHALGGLRNGQLSAQLGRAGTRPLPGKVLRQISSTVN